MARRLPKRERLLSHQLEDDLESIFLKLKTKLEILQELSDIFGDFPDEKMQMEIFKAKLEVRNDILQLQSKGVSLMDVFSRFGQVLYKAQIFQAEELLQALQSKRDPQVVDLVNEDKLLYDRIEKWNRQNDPDYQRRLQDRKANEMLRLNVQLQQPQIQQPIQQPPQQLQPAQQPAPQPQLSQQQQQQLAAQMMNYFMNLQQGYQPPAFMNVQQQPVIPPQRQQIYRQQQIPLYFPQSDKKMQSPRLSGIKEDSPEEFKQVADLLSQAFSIGDDQPLRLLPQVTDKKSHDSQEDEFKDAFDQQQETGQFDDNPELTELTSVLNDIQQWTQDSNNLDKNVLKQLDKASQLIDQMQANTIDPVNEKNKLFNLLKLIPMRSYSVDGLPINDDDQLSYRNWAAVRFRKIDQEIKDKKLTELAYLIEMKKVINEYYQQVKQAARASQAIQQNPVQQPPPLVLPQPVQQPQPAQQPAQQPKTPARRGRSRTTKSQQRQTPNPQAEQWSIGTFFSQIDNSINTGQLVEAAQNLQIVADNYIKQPPTEPYRIKPSSQRFHEAVLDLLQAIGNPNYSQNYNLARTLQQQTKDENPILEYLNSLNQELNPQNVQQQTFLQQQADTSMISQSQVTPKRAVSKSPARGGSRSPSRAGLNDQQLIIANDYSLQNDHLSAIQLIGQGLTNTQNRKAGVDFYFDPTTKKFENTVEPIIDRIDYLVPGVKQEFQNLIQKKSKKNQYINDSIAFFQQVYDHLQNMQNQQLGMIPFHSPRSRPL